MQTHVSFTVKYSKNYATYARAVKAAEMQIASLQKALDGCKVKPRFIVSVDPDHTERFIPVFMNTQVACSWFTQAGFPVVS
jgi:hypothetical protein